MIDLGDWAMERYRVPAEDHEAPEGGADTPDASSPKDPAG
jgi:endogenous inhibitor of DNA gyrase (YacG/DUF329 family)